MPLRVLATAPITFDGADGSTGHAPLVAGSVGGIDTLLVLDTGSEVHILTKELVDELGLDVEEGEEGVDHSGATMPSWSVADVSLGLGGAALVASRPRLDPGARAVSRQGDRRDPEPAAPASDRGRGDRPRGRRAPARRR